MTKFESPFGDWPKVTPVKDASAGSGVHITGRYLAPGTRKNVLAYWVIAWSFAFFCGTFWLAAHKLMSERVFFSMILASVLGYFPVWRPLMRRLLAGEVDVRVFRDAIQIEYGPSYKKNYDRSIPIEIKLEQHHKAFDAKRWGALYQQAVEVVMWYGQKRIVLAEFELRDLEMARSLVLRLQEAMLKLEMASTMAGQLASAGSTGNDLDIR